MEKDNKQLLAEHLAKVGPNPGSGFLAKWGWYAIEKRKFESRLKKKN